MRRHIVATKLNRVVAQCGMAGPNSTTLCNSGTTCAATVNTAAAIMTTTGIPGKLETAATTIRIGSTCMIKSTQKRPYSIDSFDEGEIYDDDNTAAEDINITHSAATTTKGTADTFEEEIYEGDLDETGGGPVEQMGETPVVTEERDSRSMAPQGGPSSAAVAAHKQQSAAAAGGGQQERQSVARRGAAQKQEHQKAQQIPLKDDVVPTLFPRVTADIGPLLDALQVEMGPTADTVERMIIECKNVKDLFKVVSEVVLKHPLMFDVLNGHGFRVMIVGKLTPACTRAKCPALWFDFVSLARGLGFRITRFYASAALHMIRHYVVARFEKEGRNMAILETTLQMLRELHSMCKADGVPYDHVLYARAVYCVVNALSCFDRQNQYRATFGEGDVPRREAIVVEWVLGHERCVEFDHVVALCDEYIDELIAELRDDTKVQPPFSLMMRLAEYYFVTDNVDKMLGVIETAQKIGIEVPEVVAAKFMQIACAFNVPNAPELFLKWRVKHHLSVVAAADIYRMLMFYGRSGGGKPCPKCGEKYNHRNVGRSVWEATPQHQRECPLLQMSYTHKGVLEDTPGLPPTKDYSEKAFQLLDLSDRRSMQWSEQEWRGFLLCCMFAPQAKALQAAATVVERLPLGKWDDFLKMTYLRLLRHHAPEKLKVTLQQWLTQGSHVSPLALHEVIMGAANVANLQLRVSSLEVSWNRARSTNVFIMPYAKRYILAKTNARTKELEEAKQRKSSKTSSDKEREALLVKEAAIVAEITAPGPKQTSRFNLKDSCVDLIPGTGPRQLARWGSKEYLPPSTVAGAAGRGGPPGTKKGKTGGEESPEAVAKATVVEV